MKKTIEFLVSAVLVIWMTACSDDNNEPDINTGVHKIIVELKGSPDFYYSVSFGGSTATGTTKLYDGKGKYQGEIYSVEGDLTSPKTITCYTDDDAIFLSSSSHLVCSEDLQSITYSVKAYVNDKLVNEISDTFTSGNGSTGHSVTLSTRTSN